MSKRRRKNQYNRQGNRRGVSPPPPPQPEASRPSLSLRLRMPFSKGGTKLLLQARKFPKTSGVLIVLLLSLSLFLSNFVQAVEVVKTAATVIINLYKNVKGTRKVEEITSQDRASQTNLDRHLKDLEDLRQRAQEELNELELRIVSLARTSSEYEAVETLIKNEEEKLRRIDSLLTKTLNAAKDLNSPKTSPPAGQRADSTLVPEASTKPAPQQQETHAKAWPHGDRPHPGSRSTKVSAAEIKLEDLVIEEEPHARAARPWPERENLMAGRRDSSALLATISEQYQEKLQSIYRYELRKNPALTGRIALRITIDAQGRVKERPEIMQSTFGAFALQDKILDSIMKWDGFGEVPETQGDTVFRITFNFVE